MKPNFKQRLTELDHEYQTLLLKKNRPVPTYNGIFERYEFPILTAAHIPLTWRYDLNPETNPHLIERFAINAVFNAGAIKWNDRYRLIARVEGADRKSFFAIADSPNGIDQFKFLDYPVQIPETNNPDTNMYDMRLTRHEDGWIYGLFCAERKDPDAPAYDQSRALASCGIVRTKDMLSWERLADLKSKSPQQRNVVLHPEFVDGKYAFYTRPQDGFIEAGTGGGIGFGLSESIEQAEVEKEVIIDDKKYHTVSEVKNGLGPGPIKTAKGWLHLAHGVRNTAAGLRYTLYLFMTSLEDLSHITHKPGGYFMAPEGEERVGDVSNVLFCNGWIEDPDGKVFIYYASSDSRMHVATTSVERLLDYVINTPPDELSSSRSVNTIYHIITRNSNFAKHRVPSK